MRPPIYILDTNVLSEFVTVKPEERVLSFVEALPIDDVFITYVNVAELSYGAEKTSSAQKRAVILDWIDQVILEYAERILPFDQGAAIAWGRLQNSLLRQGKPRGTMDVLIAAVAVSRNATIVTRNVRDFTYAEIPLLNPWTDPPPSTQT